MRLLNTLWKSTSNRNSNFWKVFLTVIFESSRICLKYIKGKKYFIKIGQLFT